MNKFSLVASITLTSVLSSPLWAKPQVIPKALQDIQLMKKAEKLHKLKIKGKALDRMLEDNTPANWFNMHPDEGVEGLGSDRVHEELGAGSEEIVVAVIDSGVDVNHEDLQGKIWINAGEIANNGIDDDGNGYIDDVFGWNFIGGKEGKAAIVASDKVENGYVLVKGLPEHQVDADSLEVTRELVRMKQLQEQRELTQSEREYLEKLDSEVRGEYTQSVSVLATYKKKLAAMKMNVAILKAAGLEDVSLESVRSFVSSDSVVMEARAFVIDSLEKRQDQARLQRIVDYYQGNVDYYFNEDFNPRSIVGDDYSDQTEKFYGNNDVIGPDSSHGTHVAGIIAADRDNGIGMKGVAKNVKIMAIRCVPNGDERDKDVANSIRYAVDNGAKIINMSFGKAYSPYKTVVDEAVAYAESKGVLLVHAAGNSNQNNNTAPNFPNRKAQGAEYTNWLEIGASSYLKGLNLPADFSNYGDQSVDLFSPGVDIYSTTPDNSYDTYSGTSMASPAAAGTAALVWSHNAQLSFEQIRQLMIDTSRKYEGLLVLRPGAEEEVLFESLSIHGTIVDAHKALSI